MVSKCTKGTATVSAVFFCVQLRWLCIWRKRAQHFGSISLCSSIVQNVQKLWKMHAAKSISVSIVRKMHQKPRIQVLDGPRKVRTRLCAARA